jgi:pimeloyl-ACP methyl ester carboxylesterase
MNTRSGTLVSNDMRLEYLESAGNGPQVFMLHGNSSSARTFAPWLESAAAQPFNCKSLSLPGHGLSAQAGAMADYSVPALVRLLVDLVEAEATGSYVLVGHSVGGHLFTQALPQLKRCVGLVLISAPPVAGLTEAFKPDPVGGSLFKPELDAAEIEMLSTALLGGAALSSVAKARLGTDIERADGFVWPSARA